jgi:hypothetical protein
MAFYSGCSLTIKLPPNYSKTEDLSQLLASEFEGSEINLQEDAIAAKPCVFEVHISPTAPLSGMRSSSPWKPVSPLNPAPALEDTSAQFLIHSTRETIEKFLKDSKL